MELVEQDLPYEVNENGIYLFHSRSQGEQALIILIDILLDEGFHLKEWNTL